MHRSAGPVDVRCGRRRLGFLAGLAATVLVAAGCSSSSKPTATSAVGQSRPAASGPTYTVGVITDLTGPGSSTGDTTEAGIKAGVGVAQAEGYNIRYIVTDTGTSPSGALTAAQTLVEKDHVFAVLQLSVVGFGDAAYLAAHNIPVIGSNSDGPEWLTARNMFSIGG